jgi:hypothetical protein
VMRRAICGTCKRIAPTKPANGGTDKLFLKGGRKSGLWHWCGDPAGAAVLLVAEGYATGASLHQATGRPVAVAFDAGNLAPVAKALHQAHPAALIVVCGDDDLQTFARKRPQSRPRQSHGGRPCGGKAWQCSPLACPLVQRLQRLARGGWP